MASHLKFTLYIALVLLAAAQVAAQTGSVVVKSPDGRLEMTIATVGGRGGAVSEAGGQLAYKVTFGGKPLMDWSNLGLFLQEANTPAPGPGGRGGSAGPRALGAAVRIQSSAASAVDDTWQSVQGKANPIRNHYNAVAVQTVETAATGRRLDIEARAYDDGVAFRYVAPEQPGWKEVRILNEATQFHFVKDANTFSLISRNFQTSNEDDYHELTIRGLHPEYLVNLPVTLQVPGVAWVGLTEADIEDYAGLYVTAVADQDTLTARLATVVDGPDPGPDASVPFDPGRMAGKLSVATQTPMKSPWRVLMIGAEPGRLVESNMVVNLNPPCAIADTSWIKPGKTAWDWWNGSLAKGVARPGMNNETMKYYIDFSARNKFEYMLIDAGWSAGTDLTKSSPNIDIPMLVEYAKAKNVRIWLWAHFRNMAPQMDAAFAQFEKWGIAGTKIDFMDRSDQWMGNWYRMTAKKAAEHHLMIDFHGAFKPDGMQRTYPNVLTREGVMGAEYNKWSARETPRHNVTLAFTRMLAGPMDYTPGGFDNVTREDFVARNSAPMVMGTRAHQTALFVVFESELQMVADTPDNYDGQKELDFLKAVPASWDETRVLSGRPPDYIAIARRKGKEWFLGAITNWDAREIDVPLSFLGAGAYTADIFADGPNAKEQPKDSVRQQKRVDAKTVLSLKLASGGGAAIHLAPGAAPIAVRIAPAAKKK
jgi:alpha-glucosidase